MANTDVQIGTVAALRADCNRIDVTLGDGSRVPANWLANSAVAVGIAVQLERNSSGTYTATSKGAVTSGQTVGNRQTSATTGKASWDVDYHGGKVFNEEVPAKTKYRKLQTLFSVVTAGATKMFVGSYDVEPRLVYVVPAGATLAAATITNKGGADFLVTAKLYRPGNNWQLVHIGPSGVTSQVQIPEIAEYNGTAYNGGGFWTASAVSSSVGSEFVSDTGLVGTNPQTSSSVRNYITGNPPVVIGQGTFNSRDSTAGNSGSESSNNSRDQYSSRADVWAYPWISSNFAQATEEYSFSQDYLDVNVFDGTPSRNALSSRTDSSSSRTIVTSRPQPMSAAGYIFVRNNTENFNSALLTVGTFAGFGFNLVTTTSGSEDLAETSHYTQLVVTGYDNGAVVKVEKSTTGYTSTISNGVVSSTPLSTPTLREAFFFNSVGVPVALPLRLNSATGNWFDYKLADGNLVGNTVYAARNVDFITGTADITTTVMPDMSEQLTNYEAYPVASQPGQVYLGASYKA